MILEINFKTREMLAKRADDEPYICYQCGTCTVSCLLNPALPVRRIIRNIQLGNIPKFKEVWKCISCNYCGAVCPRGVEVSKILRTVKAILYEEKTVPDSFTEVLWTIYEKGNPLGASKRERFAWAKGIKFSDEPEVLLYTCCLSAYDKRLQKTLKSLVHILQASGVKVGIMGEDEPCCGDIVYHTGEDYFFEEIASNNVSLIEKMKPSVVVTVSPHIYNILTKIYPKYEAKISMPVMHHVEYIAELMEEGRIKSGKLEKKLTYHDPCYLGRYNGVFEEPREILESIDGIQFIEMEHNKMDTLCCGGGGGGIWTENREAREVTKRRLEEAVKTEADIMVTACPYCIRMFEDELKVLRYNIPISDVVEILYESMGGT